MSVRDKPKSGVVCSGHVRSMRGQGDGKDTSGPVRSGQNQVNVKFSSGQVRIRSRLVGSVRTVKSYQVMSIQGQFRFDNGR